MGQIRKFQLKPGAAGNSREAQLQVDLNCTTPDPTQCPVRAGELATLKAAFRSIPKANEYNGIGVDGLVYGPIPARVDAVLALEASGMLWDTETMRFAIELMAAELRRK